MVPPLVFPATTIPDYTLSLLKELASNASYPV
jgi:hypothetical protein